MVIVTGPIPTQEWTADVVAVIKSWCKCDAIMLNTISAPLIVNGIKQAFYSQTKSELHWFPNKGSLSRAKVHTYGTLDET